MKPTAFAAATALGLCMLVGSGRVWGAAILILWDKVNDPDATTSRLAPVNMTGPYWTMLQGLMGDAKTKGIKRSDVTGVDLPDTTSFDATKPQPFNSVGFPTTVAGAAPPNNKPYGGIFKNNTGKTIGDIHIDVLRAGDTIDPKSKTQTEKGAFSNVTISANQRSIDFATPVGQEVVKGGFFWGFTTRLTKADNGGNYPYQGYLSPNGVNPPPKKDAEGVPKAGSNGSSMSYDGTDFHFAPSTLDTIQYQDGTTGGGSDTAFGSDVTIDDTHIVGSDPSIGGYDLADSTINWTQGSTEIVLTATLTNMILYPDNSVPGFDATIQASLVWPMGDLTLGSTIVDQLFGTAAGDGPIDFFFHGNFLDPSGAVLVGDFVGNAEVAAVVPEPSSGALLVGSVLAALLLRRRQAAR